MNIIIRGDEDKGFSSMELSSSLGEMRIKDSAVWNYHHHC